MIVAVSHTNQYFSRFLYLFFFFQAEDGIRDDLVTGVQTCALPISSGRRFSHDIGARAAIVREHPRAGGKRGAAAAWKGWQHARCPSHTGAAEWGGRKASC